MVPLRQFIHSSHAVDLYQPAPSLVAAVIADHQELPIAGQLTREMSSNWRGLTVVISLSARFQCGVGSELHQHLAPPAALRDERGDKGIAEELVVLVMNVDEQTKGLDIWAEAGEVECWRLEAGASVERVDDSPADGVDGHASGQRGDGEIQKAAEGGGILWQGSEPGLDQG